MYINRVLQCNLGRIYPLRIFHLNSYHECLTIHSLRILCLSDSLLSLIHNPKFGRIGRLEFNFFRAGICVVFYVL